MLIKYLYPACYGDFDRLLFEAELAEKWDLYMNRLWEVVEELDDETLGDEPTADLQVKFRVLASRLKFLPTVLNPTSHADLALKAKNIISSMVPYAVKGHDGALQMYVCEALAAFHELFKNSRSAKGEFRAALETLCRNQDINVQLAALVAFEKYAVHHKDLVDPLLTLLHKASFSKSPHMRYITFTCEALLADSQLLARVSESPDIILLKTLIGKTEQPFSRERAKEVLRTGSTSEKQQFLENAVYYLCHFSGLFSSLERQKSIDGGRMDLEAVLGHELQKPFEGGFPIIFEAKALTEKATSEAIRQLHSYCVVRQRLYKAKLGILVSFKGVTKDADRLARSISDLTGGVFLHMDDDELFSLLDQPFGLQDWLKLKIH